MKIPVLTTKAKKELRTLQKQYKEAVTEYEKLKKIEDDTEDQALSELDYIVNEGERANHENSFLLDDLELDVMLKRRQMIIQALGYDYPDYDKVFSYDAWQRKREVEKLILKWGKNTVAKDIGLNNEEWETLTGHWKHSEDFIRLTMKLNTK